MLVVLISFFVTRNTVDRELNIRVDDYASITQDLIDDELKSSEDNLWAGAGLLNSSEVQLTNEEWSEFYEQSGIQDRFAGVRGLGYAEIVNRIDLSDFENDYDVAVYPESENSVTANVVYLYPNLGNNRNVLGFDMYSNDIRREAMFLARDTNEAFMTKPTVLVQRSDATGEPELGFILYVPRYTRNADRETLDERRENIKGYVYSVFTAKDFLSSALLRQSDDRFSYQVMVDDMVLYEEAEFAEMQTGDFQEQVISSTLKGVDFDIRYVYNPSEILPNSIRSQPVSVLLIGVTGASLATFLTWLLLSNRNKELLLEKERDINDAKDSLLSIASHQLRTPATGVKQDLGMVLQGMAGDVSDTQRNFLEKAYESNDRQLKTINDVLYLARLEAGRIVLSKTKIKMRTILYSLIEEMHDNIEENNHKLVVKAPKKAVYVWADEHMVRMILENLLSNAIKYTPEGGKIKVVLRKSKGGIKVSVEDSGVGIKDDQKDEIFKQFSRVGNSLSKSVSGSGVGLYLVKNLVEMHEGEITVESDGENGSTFTVYLPTNKPIKT